MIINYINKQSTNQFTNSMKTKNELVNINTSIYNYKKFPSPINGDDTEEEQWRFYFDELDLEEKMREIKHLTAIGNLHRLQMAVDDVNLTDLSFDHNILLKIAVTNWCCDVIKYLLQYGVDVAAEDNWAIKTSKDRFVTKLLLDSGADAAADNNYPICAAADSGDLDIIEILAQHGADLRARSEYPLRISSYRDNLDVMHYLLINGADIHTHNDYPLHITATKGILKG